MNATLRVSTARALAETFLSMRELGIANRERFGGILQETLSRNPEYLEVIRRARIEEPPLEWHRNTPVFN
ncbi:MAG: hypothetical protein WCH43_01215 [Verrucomicrobiota bacterium]